MTKKKLLVCIDSLGIGGAEKLVVDLLRHWDQLSWDLYLVTYSGEKDFDLDQGRIIHHYVLEHCSNIRSVALVYRICRENGIHIALCHLERPNKWMALGARLAGALVIATMHSTGLYEAKSSFKRFLVRNFYNLVPARIVSVSGSVTQYLRDFGIRSERIITILNGIDVDYLRRRWHVESKDNTLCVLARLEPVKGLDLLLTALARLRGRSWSLKIVGDGSQRGDLEKLAIDLSITNRIVFLGRQPDPFSHLLDVSLLCMPSYREGLPMALLECLSLGIPAIVSDVGYLPVVVKDGVNGFIFHSGSVDELSQCIGRFLDTGEAERKALAQNARESVEQYDITKCVVQYMALTESIYGTK